MQQIILNEKYYGVLLQKCGENLTDFGTLRQSPYHW